MTIANVTNNEFMNKLELLENPWIITKVCDTIVSVTGCTPDIKKAAAFCKDLAL